MFVGRLAGMVGFRTHTFTRIGSIMDKKQPGSTKPQYFHLQQNAHQT